MDDKKINQNLEHLIDGVEYLIDFFERQSQESKSQKSEGGLSSLELTDNLSNISTDIKNNTSSLKNIQQSLNQYIQHIESIQAPQKQEEIVNADTDQQISNSMQIEFAQLSNDLNGLSQQIKDWGINLDLSLQPEALAKIREQLNNINIAIPSLEPTFAQIDLIKKSLESINDIKVAIEFDNIDNIKLPPINLDVLKSENLNNVIQSIEQLQQVSINLNIDTASIERIQSDLVQLQKFNFDNLDFSKIENLALIDFSHTIESLNELNSIQLTNIPSLIPDTFISDIETLQTKVSDFKNEYGTLEITPTLKLSNVNEFVSTIQEQVKDVEVAVKVNPEIDLSLIEEFKKEYSLKIKPEIEEPELKIQPTVLDRPLTVLTPNTLPVQDTNSEVNQKILEQLVISNNLSQELIKSMSNNKNTIIQEVSKKSKDSDKESIGQVSNITIEETNEMSSLIKIMSNTNQIMNSIYLELVKNRFNDNLDLK